MSLRVRIRWLLVVSAAICVALATVALYWVNLALMDTLMERNAERELGKVEAAFLDQLSVLRVRAQDWSQQPEQAPVNQGGVGHLALHHSPPHAALSHLRPALVHLHLVMALGHLGGL